MDQLENTQVRVDEMNIGMWTFRRSQEPLATQLEGKVLRASWEHKGHYFAVWEPELLEAVPESGNKVQPCHAYAPINREKKGDDNFFRSHKGAPRVDIAKCPEEGSREWRITPLHVTHDFLTAMRPATFGVPPVIYHAELYGWECTIIGQVQGRTLEDVFWDVLGPDTNESWQLNDSTSPGQIVELTRICTQVADQVVDAVVEMSKNTADSVCGVDKRASPDIHFSNTEMPSQEKAAQNCKDAGMDPCHTVLGPGDLQPKHIVLDKDGNFVGFGFLEWAGFAPREWVQFGTIDPSDVLAAGIVRHARCELPGRSSFKLDPKSVLLLWQNILSEKLASKGFAKLDPHRLRWLQRPKTEPGPGPRQQAESCPKSESRLSRGFAKLDAHWPRRLRLGRGHDDK